jgi:hypothetical protein
MMENHPSQNWKRNSLPLMLTRAENMSLFFVGEVVIRQALSELEVWEIEAKFSFVGHQVSIS